MPAPADKMAGIAGRGALRDLEQVRGVLLRIRADWAPIDDVLEGQTGAVVNDLDQLITRIGKVSGAQS